MLDKIGHFMGDSYRSVAKNIIGVLKESRFYQEGVLTPEEYVRAGDFLTSKCPTWKWCSATTGKLKCDYLPENKQYLQTSQVPCSKRAREVDISNKTSEKDVGDGWIETNVEFEKGKNREVVDVDQDKMKKDKPVVIDNTNLIKEDYFDIEIVNDDKINIDSTDDNEIIVVESNDVDNIFRTRSYDVSVTYDYYYRVPRIWLVGYNEQGNPLKNEEIYEDIMEEYIERTVTIENHPHTDLKCINVHPCHHAELIKKMIDNMELAGKKMDVEIIIVLFLKFLHSIVPTIQYDFTMSVEF